jgi:hypothetical protein
LETDLRTKRNSGSPERLHVSQVVDPALIPLYREVQSEGRDAESTAGSSAFRDPPSSIPLTAREDDKLFYPTEFYWFGTQN